MIVRQNVIHVYIFKKFIIDTTWFASEDNANNKSQVLCLLEKEVNKRD